MTPVAVWWPTPSSPAGWFTADERAGAARYHGPRQRMAVGRTIGQWTLLGAVWLAAAGVDGPMESVWLTVETLVIAFATALAFWVPSTVVEVWSEFRHEPKFDRVPVSTAKFASTSVALLLVEIVGFTGLSVVLGSVGASARSAAAVTLVAGLLPLVSLLVGPAFALAVHRARPLDATDEAELRALAVGSGMPDVRFVELEHDGVEGPNAFATGVGRRATIGLSASLLAESEGLRSHIIAHELAHLRRRHVLWSALAAGFGAMLVVGASLWIVRVLLGDDPGWELLPAFVLIAALVSWPVRLVLAWMSRAHERRADLEAVRLTGIDSVPIREFHVSERAILEPSMLVRLHAAHPSPAERLELLKRARNIGPGGRD